MKTRITTTAPAAPLGPERTRRLLAFDSGPLAGRRLAVFLSAAQTVSFCWADRPFTQWSTPIMLTNEVAGANFCAAIDGSTTLLLVHTDSATAAIKSVRAVWTGATWQIGEPVIAFTGDINSDPSLVIDTSGGAWLAWSRLVSNVRHIHVKHSGDLGLTWGSGSGDPGEEVHEGGLIAVSSLTTSPGCLYVAYYYDSLQICVRRKLLPEGAWSAPAVIASGNEASPVFACATRSDGLLGIAYGVTQVLYREFDGMNLGPAIPLYASTVGSLQVTWRSQYPMVAFTVPSGDNQYRILTVDRSTGEFTPADNLDPRNDIFTYVLAFNSAAGTFADLTAAAQSFDAGDLYHPASGALLQHYGDALYLGMDQTFRTTHLLLSQPGAGGTVGFSYWNGSQWIAFTPFAGTVPLDQSDSSLRFWKDYDSVPPDWQRVVVDSRSAFWIRAIVLNDFTTAPIGSLASAISNVTALCLGRS